MQVFLVRHAEAVPETLGLRDPHRQLTPHGRTQARDLGDRLRWHDCLPNLVWSSPLVRAVQTAELVIGGLQHDVPVDIATTLAPDGSARELLAALKALPRATVVMLVGHEPSLSAIGALLVGDPDFEALGKACAARLDDGRVRWRFAWNDEAPTAVDRRPA
ncbi:MAG: histidine phosphatase family protein [Myxococcales bacterium]|nr:histidine phosphatase family protein [Myxococcales bacterium]